MIRIIYMMITIYNLYLFIYSNLYNLYLFYIQIFFILYIYFLKEKVTFFVLCNLFLAKLYQYKYKDREKILK